MRVYSEPVGRTAKTILSGDFLFESLWLEPQSLRCKCRWCRQTSRLIGSVVIWEMKCQEYKTLLPFVVDGAARQHLKPATATCNLELPVFEGELIIIKDIIIKIQEFCLQH